MQKVVGWDLDAAWSRRARDLSLSQPLQKRLPAERDVEAEGRLVYALTHWSEKRGGRLPRGRTTGRLRRMSVSLLEPAMRIVADENIPLVDAFFGGLGEIRRLPGRAIDAAALADAELLLVRSVT